MSANRGIVTVIGGDTFAQRSVSVPVRSAGVNVQFIYHHRTAGRGGEGVHITSVVRALRVAGHDVDLVSPPGVDPMRGHSTAPLDKGARDTFGIVQLWKWISCSCPQLVFEMLELLYNVYALVRLFPEFWRKKDAAYYERHAFFLFAGVWLAKCFGRRVILEVNEVAGIKRARGQRWVGLARWISQRTFRQADHILTVSPLLQRVVLGRGGRPGHVHVVPNAIDPARFRRTRGHTVRARLGLNDARVIGFVGWFDRWDHLDRLIDLVLHLRLADPTVRLLLVGDGADIGELSARIVREGLERCVIFSGPVAAAEVPDYIDAMDICVIPDATEFCSPLVLFEFMAVGKPIVAPDTEPIRAVLTHRTTGWIFNHSDPAAFREGVERLLGDFRLARRIGDAARREVFAYHTWDAIAALVEVLARNEIQHEAADALPLALAKIDPLLLSRNDPVSAHDLRSRPAIRIA